VPITELNKLVQATKYADIVIGSRMAKGAQTKMSLKRRIVGICFHLVCLPLLPKIKDASCGAKLFKTSCAKEIFALQKIKRFAFDIEILWLAKKLNYKIKEVGVFWQEIPGSKVRVLQDGAEMFFAVLGLYKNNFSNRIKKL
jgi:dolichyl-phosphate beta-glucosyltransferase